MLRDLTLRARRALALLLCPPLGAELVALAAEVQAHKGAVRIAERAAQGKEALVERLRAAEEWKRDAEAVHEQVAKERDALANRCAEAEQRAQVAEAAAGTARDEMVLAQDLAARHGAEVERLKTAEGELRELQGQWLTRFRTALRDLANRNPVLTFRGGERRCTFCEAPQVGREPEPRCPPGCVRVVALRLAEGECPARYQDRFPCEGWREHRGKHHGGVVAWGGEGDDVR